MTPTRADAWDGTPRQSQPSCAPSAAAAAAASRRPLTLFAGSAAARSPARAVGLALAVDQPSPGQLRGGELWPALSWTACRTISGPDYHRARPVGLRARVSAAATSTSDQPFAPAHSEYRHTGTNHRSDRPALWLTRLPSDWRGPPRRPPSRQALVHSAPNAYPMLARRAGHDGRHPDLQTRLGRSLHFARIRMTFALRRA